MIQYLIVEEEVGLSITEARGLNISVRISILPPIIQS